MRSTRPFDRVDERKSLRQSREAIETGRLRKRGIRPDAPFVVRTDPALRRSREEIEKERLQKRGVRPEDPFAIKKESSAYLPESERFRLDAAAEEKKARDAAWEQRVQKTIQKGRELEARERRLIAQEEEAKRLDRERVERMQASGSKYRRNKESTPYDPVTLRYCDGRDGDRLRHDDELRRFRAGARTHRLYQRNNGEVNPITGELQRGPPMPQRPATPPSLKLQPQQLPPLPAPPAAVAGVETAASQ